MNLPDYLLPLPKIRQETYRKYRKDYHRPRTLVELCSIVLDGIKYNEEITFSPEWPTFSEIFIESQRIVTDSARRLGHVLNPFEATAFINSEAKLQKMTAAELLRSKRIIMQETSDSINIFKLENHWKRLETPRPLPHKVLIGRYRTDK